MTERSLPGGISSNGRMLPDMDGAPLLVASSQGSTLTDTEGRSYVDYAMAMGATLLGHAPAAVVEAICRAAETGPMPGFAHAGEEAAAAALTRHTGALRHATFVNTGSEAVHLACRIARQLTGRPLIVKASAGYDGWYDDMAFGMSGSPEAAATCQRPVRGQVALLRYNDCADVDALFAERRDIAGIIVEPLLANAGSIEADPEFLTHLQSKARAAGVVLIADEVLAGLRLHAGLSSHKIGWSPDLATLGKAIGSGVPVAAVVGTSEAFAPIVSGAVARAGTYNGNPLVCAAVSATMERLADADYQTLLARGAGLRAAIAEAFALRGLTVCTSGWDSVFSVWFAQTPPKSYAEALPLADANRSLSLHFALRRQGVLVMPSMWGRFFVSFAHGAEDLARTSQALAAAAGELSSLYGRSP